MGAHFCDLPPCGGIFGEDVSSSGENFLFYRNAAYRLPDWKMIRHYIEVHGYKPPDAFIQDVMENEPTSPNHHALKTCIGFLDKAEPFDTGPVPPGFLAKLQEVMWQAERAGNRMQTRGM